MKSSFKNFTEYKKHLISILESISDADVEKAVEMILETHHAGRWVYVIGNGGSASTASHMACDLNKGACKEASDPLRVISLTDNMAHFSALGNDEGYENVFIGQLRNILEKGDLLIGISASGNSPNCVNAFELAKEKGVKTLGLLGFEGGKMNDISDFSILAKSEEYGPIEDVHLILNHIFTELLKNHL